MKTRKPIIKITLIVLVAFVTGCYYDSEERLNPKLSSPCDDVNVTFSHTIKPILNLCQSCHSNTNASSGGDIMLQDYADVKTYVTNGRLMGAVNHNSGFSAMPKGGVKLLDCEIIQLQKWITEGALNN